ncbi:phage-related protein [Herbihabitans rhizosphaerae]|uniref:Phage-related protein n=1 Tax=Herbihabitans rhizosphaerae TaxID=1872711 RepID=A0A4V2ESY1_9PSEU|nr:hypothetical protein [Herbihabitans rhizosphaerae]RZS39153.1 phage-related protein [Herbihabitans rhizosphaerae]
MPDSTGKVVARAAVRVLPDTKQFAPALDKYLRKIEARTRLNIKTVADTTGLGREVNTAIRAIEQRSAEVKTTANTIPASAEVEAWRKRVERTEAKIRVAVDKTALAALNGIGKSATFSVKTVGVAAAIASVAGLVAIAGQAAVAVGQMSGALGLIPAIGAVVGSALATLIVGFEGFGAALSSMSDPAAFAEALKNLAPSAREAAIAFRDLKPAFHQLRLDVQQELFRGLGQEIRAVGKDYAPILSRGLQGIAKEANLGAKEFSAFLKQAQTKADFGVLFENAKQSVRELALAIRPLFEAFRDIGTVGSEFLPGLSSGLREGAERFRDFIAEARKTGKLREWISNGLSAIGDFFQVLKNLGSIIGSLFKAANVEGVSLLSVLKNGTKAVADFLKSADGVRMLRQVFGGLGDILEGMTPLFMELGRVFKDVIAPLIQRLGPQIGDVFASLAPAVEPFAKIIEALAPVLVTVADVVARVLVKALQALQPAIEKAAPAFERLARAIGDALIKIIEKVDWQKLADGFVRLVDAALPMIELFANLASHVIPLLVSALSGIGPGLVIAGAAVLAFRKLLSPLATLITGSVTSALVGLPRTVDSSMGKVEKTAAARMKGLGKVLIGGLAAASLDWDYQWDQNKNAVENFGSFVSNSVENLWYGITGIFGNERPTYQLIEATDRMHAAATKGAANIMGAFVPVPLGIAGAFAAAEPVLQGAGADAARNVGAGILAGTPSVVAEAGKLPAGITGSLTAASSLFGAAGVGVVASVGAGILANSGAVTGATDSVKDSSLDIWASSNPDHFSSGWENVGQVGIGIIGNSSSVFGATDSVTRGTVGRWLDTRPAMNNAGRSVVGEVGAGILSSAHEPWSSTDSVGRGILSRITDIRDDMERAGSSVIAGVTAGIQSGAGGAFGAAGQVATGIIAKFKGLMGIKSPSKVFRKLGVWTMQGYTQGIEHESPRVLSALSTVADDATSHFRQVSAAFDTDDGMATSGGIALTQNIYPQPEQSEISIAVQASRQLGRKLRTMMG